MIVVPGYGLAVAQAQHSVRELADVLEAKGVDVKYAIHPVAGRMPGHMNVLLAEANAPYPQLREMEDINPEFDRAMWPLSSAPTTSRTRRRAGRFARVRHAILDVDHAKNVIVIKRSMGRGYAGMTTSSTRTPRPGCCSPTRSRVWTDLVAAVKAL